MPAWIQIGKVRRASIDHEARVKKAASALTSIGIKQGDVVALCMRNDFPFLEAAHGAARVGAYVTPINWHSSVPEAAYVLQNSGAKALLIHEDLLERLGAAIPENISLFVCPVSADIASDYNLARSRSALPARAKWWAQWIESFPPSEAPPPPSPGSMIYTSGTTGIPKAVRRQSPTPQQAQKMFEHNGRLYGAPARRSDPEEIVAMAAGPLYHSAPLAYMNYFTRLGCRLILEPKFDAERFLRLIASERVTHVLAVPTMFVRLLTLPQELKNAHDVSSLKFVMHGAAPCSPHVKREMIEWWGPVIFEHYGGTETGALTFCSSHEWLERPGTVGRAMDGVALRVLDSSGNDCAAGDTGDIFGRIADFPDFTYVGDEAKRSAVERHGLISLGDRGYLDRDGYLFLTGRSSDMIISGGANIYPAEIEAAILRAPGVQDCAVFGIPDAEFGESVCAVVQARQGDVLDPEALRIFLRSSLATYKVPKRFEIRDDLPREDSGKIFKVKLRAPYWKSSGRDI